MGLGKIGDKVVFVGNCFLNGFQTACFDGGRTFRGSIAPWVAILLRALVRGHGVHLSA